MTWTVVSAFFLAIVPIVLTPGASLTLVTQRTFESASGQAVATSWVIAGTATGIYTHALLAGFGLSVLIMQSSYLFEVVKLLGAAYLIGLGALTLWRCRAGHVRPSARRRLPWSGHHAFPQAVLANVLNPKASAVYLTLAPQFLNARQIGVFPMLVLATVHVVAMASWLAIWSLAMSFARRATSSNAFRTWVNRLGGAVLVALGIRTAAAA